MATPSTKNHILPILMGMNIERGDAVGWAGSWSPLTKPAEDGSERTPSLCYGIHPPVMFVQLRTMHIMCWYSHMYICHRWTLVVQFVSWNEAVTFVRKKFRQKFN